MKIKNGDGVVYIPAICNGLSTIKRLACQLQNVIVSKYKDLTRVQKAEIRINDIIVLSSNQINRDVAAVNVQVSLKAINSLKITLHGSVFSSLEVKIDQISSPTEDREPPVILSNINSNTLTNKNSLTLTVSDLSSVTTTIRNQNGNLILETTAKSIVVPLVEGVNNLVVTSIDQFGNTSQNFNLNQIISDTLPASLIYQISSQYVYSSYPQNIILSFVSNEPLSYLIVNNAVAIQVSPTTYSISLTIPVPSVQIFNISYSDLAGNIKTESVNVTFSIDQIAPTILSSIESNKTVNQNNLTITIVDNSDVITEVYRNNILLQTESSKAFEVTLVEGVNNFVIKSIDQYGNQSIDLILNQITLDTSPASVITNIKQNYIYKLLPAIETLEIQTSESLKNLQINGVTVNPVSDKNYFYQVQFTNAQAYAILITATDLAGNQTNINKIVNILLDQIPPVLGYNYPDTFLVNELPIEISINFKSDEMLKAVEIDGVQTEVIQLPDRTSTFKFTKLVSTEGLSNFSVKAYDSVGNETVLNLTYNVVIDNAGPFLVQISPSINQIIKDKTVNIELKSNRPIDRLILNGTLFNISEDGLTATKSIVVPYSGKFKLQVRGIAGNENVEKEITFEIDRSTISPWDYKECPIPN